MGEASCYFGIAASLMGFFNVVIGLNYSFLLKVVIVYFILIGCLFPLLNACLAERYGVGHLRTRSIIGIIGLIIFTFLQKWALLTNNVAPVRRHDGTPFWVGSPEVQFFTIAAFALFFHSLFAFESAIKQMLPYGKHPLFVTVMCLLSIVSAVTEAWLLNFEKARGFSPALNVSLGACFLDLYIVMKTDF